jgi:hypothetical protein
MTTLVDHSVSEQLQLPLEQAQEGLTPLRLLEPLSSLALTPFALKAAKGSGASTVGELASLVFEREKECRGMGQGHIEEIRRKIEQFVGHPPYALEQSLDLGSLLRLTLLPLEGSDRGIIVTRCQLQSTVALLPQESKEAEMALLLDREGKFRRALVAAQPKVAAPTRSLLERVFTGFVRPSLARRGGIVHEQELLQFCFEKSTQTDYRTFERIIVLLQHLLQTPFLFAPFLCQIQGRMWALSTKEQAFAQQIISDAQTLVRNGEGGQVLKELARALARCRFTGWEECSSHTIERILFWHFTVEPLPGQVAP